MLTNRDVEVYAETGLVPPDRLQALKFALGQLSLDARTKSHQLRADGELHAGAALAGKAGAYAEAARMVQHIIDARALHPRRFSSVRAKAAAARLARIERAHARRDA